jgi:uncharacterized damage-inducible protein DinB
MLLIILHPKLLSVMYPETLTYYPTTVWYALERKSYLRSLFHHAACGLPKEIAEMAEDNFTLTTFYTSWNVYQDRLKAALAPLTPSQLALRAAPDLRSIGENALHIVGCRVFWLTEFLGEDGGEEMKGYAPWNEVALRAPYATWDEVALALRASAPTGAELAQGLDRTWKFMADCLARWSPADMQQTFSDEGDDTSSEVSRAWVVWHVLEHDLHHGGEISLTLGMHGLPADFAV